SRSQRWDRPGDVLAGPVFVAAADTAMWVAVMTRAAEVMAVTANLNSAFLAAGRQETVTCEARVLRFGRRLVYGVAECRGEDGRVPSQHTVTYARPACAPIGPAGAHCLMAGRVAARTPSLS